METDQPVYLSRLMLDPQHRLVQRAIADCGVLHRQIMAAFPDLSTDAARAALGVLYRPEVHPVTGAVSLLVQSAGLPDWSRAMPLDHGGHGYLLDIPPPDTNPAVKRIDENWQALAPGNLLRFRLRGNATKRLPVQTDAPSPDRLAGKRIALLRSEDQLGWLKRKLVMAGCTMIDAATRPDALTGSTQRGWRRKEEGERQPPLEFGAVLFDGVLRVEDPVLLGQALRAGIGPAKAYGFGLLSLAPIR